MATATASSTSSSTAAASGQGTDDNFNANQGTEAGATEAQGRSDGSAGSSADTTTSATAQSEPAAASSPPADDSRLAEPLRAERRKSNQLEKEIRTLRQQLNRFSEINPEEYARLQQAERQKQVLEQQMELRERQMEEASAQKVAAVASERDEARQQILQLRKDRLLERVFSQAEGRSGGDGRGTFFDIFKGQLGSCFRLSSGSDGKDGLEPLDSQGKPLLGDDGRPMTTTEFLDQMRVHPVYGFLFQQRGPAGMQAAAGLTVSGIGSNGEPINPPGDVGIGAVSGFLRGEWAGCSSLRSGDGKEAPQLLCRSRRFEVSSINSRSRSLPTSAPRGQRCTEPAVGSGMVDWSISSPQLSNPCPVIRW